MPPKPPIKLVMARTSVAPRAQARVAVRPFKSVVARSSVMPRAQARGAVRARPVAQSRSTTKGIANGTADFDSRTPAITALSAAAWAFFGPNNIPLNQAIINARVMLAVDATTKLLDHCCWVIKKRWFSK